MDHGLQLIVYRSKEIFDNVIVKPQCVLKYDEINGSNHRKLPTEIVNRDTCKNIVKPIKLNRKGFTAYLVSTYIITLSNSYSYRKSALRILLQWLHIKLLDIERIQKIFIKLRIPRKQFLDYKWNEILMQIILERSEADHAMSWLSTLGGAFSALGENFEHCAKMAGKISMRQFELALRLDDPLLVARCKLYSALSLIQRGYLTAPQIMIKNIYRLALEEKDVRLQNMCQGVWAKLQYCYKQYKWQKRQSHEVLHISKKS